MRKIQVEYRCDRCGEEFFAGGEDKRAAAQLLNNDGWRGMTLTTYIGTDTDIIGNMPVKRDLCRLCYVGLVAYFEMDDREMDKDTLATVE